MSLRERAAPGSCGSTRVATCGDSSTSRGSKNRPMGAAGARDRGGAVATGGGAVTGVGATVTGLGAKPDATCRVDGFGWRTASTGARSTSGSRSDVVGLGRADAADRGGAGVDVRLLVGV